jgi:hypothetical protein
MKLGFTNNQLKIIAMVCMLIDHVGAYLLPQYRWMRIVGRLAYPIFAYMIAEGCHHTRNRLRHLLVMAGFAAVCQLVYYFALDSLYMCILVTFTLSIGLIYAIDIFRKHKGIFSGLLAAMVFGAVLYACYFLPGKLPGFYIDYSFLGVMLPVVIYLVPDRQGKLFAAAVVMIAMSGAWGNSQWYALLALPLLALYNEKRGKASLKYLFYIFYPAHLVLIHGIKYFFM